MKLPVLLFMLVGAQCALAQQPKSQKQLSADIDQIFSRYAQKTGPGYAMAIIKDGRVLVQKTNGLADLEHSVSISATTLFHIASVSKQFTGLAISMLVQKGQIDLKTDIHSYIPELPEYGKKITVANLLHHTSGIPDCYMAMTITGWKWEDVFGFDDILRTTYRLKELNFEPGTQYAYSNTEYVLLQEIVQRTTKKNFPEWTRDNILSPIGMKSSFFLSDYGKVITSRAESYAATAGGFKRDPQQTSGMPMYSTLNDIVIWAQHFSARLAAKDPIYERMIMDDTLSNGRATNYGYGLILGRDRGVATIMHTGAWGGYRAVIRSYPKQRLAVIILGNAGDNELNYTTSFQLASLFISGDFTQPLEVPTPDPIQGQPMLCLDEKKLKRFEGTYKLGGGAYTITNVNGNPHIEYLYQGSHPMEARSDSSFWVPAYSAAVRFDSGDIKATAFTLRGSHAQRIEPNIPTLSQLKALAGTFFNAELLVGYEVVLTGDQLALRQQRRADIVLYPHPTEKDVFISELGTVAFSQPGSAGRSFTIGKIAFREFPFPKQ